jgi:flavin-dependent dehydrogenase
MTVTEALRLSPSLAALGDDELASIAGAMHAVERGAGHVFVREGERDDTIHLVVAGEVAVRRGGRTLEPLGPGALFGLIALVDDAPRAADCVATTAATVAMLSRADYERLVGANERIALAFQQTIAAQLARDFRNVSAQIHRLLNATDGQDGEIPVEDCDVVVIGGGPLGIMYATWVRRFRPASRVIVVERRDHPGHKVGESTLATTVRAFRAMGLTHPVMRRLFGNKAGLRWFHVNRESDTLNRQIDVVDIEETYQVERRTLESALHYLATTREGVELIRGTKVLVKESEFDGEFKSILCETADKRRFRLRCRVVCDASGPASLLPHHFGLYRKQPEAHRTFNYNSYFAYFRVKSDVPVDFWSYPATRHLCFPEGWMWMISLISWRETSDENMDRIIQALIDWPDGPDETYPTREALNAKYGGVTEPIVSIGLTIRDDRDVSHLRVDERFQYWVNQYPAMRWVMEHFELIDAPYEGKDRSYSAFMQMLHDVERPAGDGWCAIGDSAMFLNPFFSLGMNYGSGTAYMAARDTADGLAAGNVSQAAFDRYSRYIRAIFDQYANEIDMYYRAFDDEDSYERAIALKLFFAISDVLPRNEYNETDAYIWNPLDPAWLDISNRVADTQRAGEINGTPPAEVARQVHAMADPFIEEIARRPEVRALEVGRYLHFYDDLGHRTDARHDKKRGAYAAIRCASCTLFYDDTLAACPNCGAANPHRAT